MFNRLLALFGALVIVIGLSVMVPSLTGVSRWQGFDGREGMLGLVPMSGLLLLLLIGSLLTARPKRRR
jgi:hypothetical protein